MALVYSSLRNTPIEARGGCRRWPRPGRQPWAESPPWVGQASALQEPCAPSTCYAAGRVLVIGDSGFGSHRCPSVLGFSQPPPCPAGVGSQAARMFWSGRLGLTLAGRGHPGCPRIHNSRSPPATSRIREVFIAASGHQEWRRQQELWHRPPPQALLAPSPPLPAQSLSGASREGLACGDSRHITLLPQAPEGTRCHSLPGRCLCPSRPGQDLICLLRPWWASH